MCRNFPRLETIALLPNQHLHQLMQKGRRAACSVGALSEGTMRLLGFTHTLPGNCLTNPLSSPVRENQEDLSPGPVLRPSRVLSAPIPAAM